jgi:peptidyl-prolyl cis-trans isomerase D
VFEGIYKKRKNPIFNIAGWFLLVLVCLIFMFVGYSPDVDFMGSGSSVAQVNGETISYTEFSRYLDRVQESRGAAKMSEEERKRLNREVVDSLVNRTLIIQAAKKQGIAVGDEEIRDFLRKIPQFQDKGVFSVLRYKELLRAQGLSEGRFEEQIVEDMLVQKMNEFYQKTSVDSDLIEKQEDVVSKVKLNLQFIKKTPQDLVADSDVSEKEIADYISLQSKKIADYYENNKATFQQKEGVRAQHILIKTSPQMTDEKALAKINDIAKKLNKDNFTEMAKTWTEDPGSKATGGDLGFFERGRMVPEFDQVAFSSGIGEISKPFKSSFGYHILMVNEKREAKTPVLEDVKKQIALNLIKQDKKQDAVKNINEKLVAGTIDTLLAEKGWVWDETGAFGLGDMMVPKLGDNNEVLTAALTLTPQNPIYKNVVEKDGSYYMVKLKSIEAASTGVAKKDQPMDYFKQIMERQKSYEMFQGWMDQLRKTASITINEKVISQ